MTRPARFSAIALAIASLLAFGCASNGKSPMRLTDWESGESIDIALGREIELRLGSNPTTGYYWVWADSATSQLERVMPTEFERNTAAVSGGSIGGGGHEVWLFRAATRGTTTLRMLYKRPMQSDVPEREVRYVFNVK